MHDVHITRRTKKIEILRLMIKGNETGHIYMQVQTGTKILSIPNTKKMII